MIETNTIIHLLPSLLKGAAMSIAIASVSMLIGFVLGTILGFIQAYNKGFLHMFVNAYTFVLRGTPMLIQIFFMAYILPSFGIHLSLFLTAAIAIGLNSSAYVSQITLSGISAVAHGQWEAAYSLGFSPLQTIRYITLPQVISITLPTLLSEMITLVKDSSLASTIGVVELVKQGNIIISKTYNAIPVYCAIAVIYLLITSALIMLAKRVKDTYTYHA